MLLPCQWCHVRCNYMYCRSRGVPYLWWRMWSNTIFKFSRRLVIRSTSTMNLKVAHLMLPHSSHAWNWLRPGPFRYSHHYKSHYYTSDMAVTVAVIYYFYTGLEMRVCVCVCVVYGSVKGSAQPWVREMDEGVEPQTLIYICWLSSHQHPATTLSPNTA